jgi:hypothetical protein
MAHTAGTQRKRKEQNSDEGFHHTKEDNSCVFNASINQELQAVNKKDKKRPLLSGLFEKAQMNNYLVTLNLPRA